MKEGGEGIKADRPTVYHKSCDRGGGGGGGGSKEFILAKESRLRTRRYVC